MEYTNQMTLEEFGRYKIKGRLGQGGMATVYSAYDPQMGRDVAIKTLPRQFLDDPKFLGRFKREAKTVANLEHPAIVPVYDYGEADGQPYLVMRHMTGGSLANLLKRGPIDRIDALSIVARIAGALDEAHKKGLVHRDLKPDNILLDDNGKAYLADFGIVKLLKDNITFTDGNAIIGTPAYMSPEQAKGKQDIDGSADIYALGAILYHMLAGRPPYEGETPLSVAMQQIQSPIPRLLEARPDLPPNCETVIAKSMAKERDGRFATASDFAEAFQTAIQSSSQEEVESDQLVQKRDVPTLAAAEDSTESPDEISFDAPVSPSSGIFKTVNETTQHLKRRFKMLPWQARGGIISLTFILLFFAVYQILFAKPDSTPVASSTAVPPTAILSPTQPATPTLSPTPPPEPAPDAIIILADSPSAIWQLGDEPQFIPDDGEIPITSSQESLILHSNADLLTLLLPDRTTLYLDTNTSIEFTRIAGIGKVTETAVTLQRGRLAAAPVGQSIAVLFPSGDQVQAADGLLGVEFEEQLARFGVDCLRGACRLLPQEANERQLAEGEYVYLDEDGRVSDPHPARYDVYMGIVNPVPTATPEPTATATPTSTATATATRSTVGLGPETLIIGRSVQEESIEAVRIGAGARKFIFVGGLQAGYAPNSVVLAEAFVNYFSDDPTTVPEDATVYIVPNLNPDSPEKPGQLSGRFNANGVDLNRNWGCRWSPDPIIFRQVRPGSGGATPFSEPETLALAEFIAAQSPTAVIFWTAHRDPPVASPGACIENSRVSVSLAHLYGQEAIYNYVNSSVVLADPDLTGDAVNFLDDQGIPAIAVVMSDFWAIDWEQNLAGVTAVLDEYDGVGPPIAPLDITIATPSTAAPTACEAVAERWAYLHNQYETSLGCPTSHAAHTGAAFQQYDNGLMVWRGDTDQVYILSNDRTLATHIVNEAQPYNETELLKGAFGYLWHTNLTVSASLGNPQDTEKVADDFVVQDFRQGTIFYFSNNGKAYALFTTTNTWQDFPE
ncbi:MAG: protein kinase [Chloroflexi bacterium]|nr:protein kinase [Chloroflexota bacterium]